MSTGKGRNLRSRTILVIEAVTSAARRFKELEVETGIPAGTWRSFWNRDDVSPSGAMLEQIALHWPQYIFWTLTGITDPEAGHVAPLTANHLRQEDRTESSTANAYFNSRIRVELSRPQLPQRGTVTYKEVMEQKALKLLGGYAGYEATRYELEEREIIPREPYQLDRHGIPYAGRNGQLDPVMARAIQTAERDLLPLYSEQLRNEESEWEKRIEPEVEELRHLRRAELLARLQTTAK